jgi:hypothetical protein
LKIFSICRKCLTTIQAWRITITEWVNRLIG